jgi:sulfiredoxin
MQPVLAFATALALRPVGLEARAGKAGWADRATVEQEPSRASRLTTSSRKASPFRRRSYHAVMSEMNADDDPGGPKGVVFRDICIKDILRPLSGTRTNDQEKVHRLMDSIAKEGQKTAIDVLDVEGRYYGFNGCHRFEACQKLGQKTIRCRVFKATRDVLLRQMM